MIEQHLSHKTRPRSTPLVRSPGYASRSTLVTSQLPLAQWHERLGDPTLADAILDRLVHNAYKLQLKGGSMRKHHSGLTHADHCTA